MTGYADGVGKKMALLFLEQFREL